MAKEPDVELLFLAPTSNERKRTRIIPSLRITSDNSRIERQ